MIDQVVVPRQLLGEAYQAIMCLVRTEHLGRADDVPCPIGPPLCVECSAEVTAHALLAFFKFKAMTP